MTDSTALYQRLGAAKGIARLVDDLVAAHLVNPIIKARFENILDLDHAKQVARSLTPARTCSARTRV